MNNEFETSCFTKEMLFQSYDKVNSIKNGSPNERTYKSLYPMGGIQIIEDDRLVDESKTEVLKTWKERLFSLPWHPFKKTKTIVTYTPKQEVLQYGNMIICHPEVAITVRKELSKIK